MLLIILEQNFSKNSFYKMSDFKIASKLGVISYGLYCLHFIGILVTITITEKLHINESLWSVLLLEPITALLITIIISKISYRFFESPFLRLKEKFAYIIK
jgi:peptidoglycan/LPS O-acetylase OafA/YrhL